MLTLLASPNYQGPTVIDAGTLQLASPDSGATWATLPDTAVNLTTSGATLDANGFNQTIGSLRGVVGTLVKLGGSNLTVGDDNTSTTFAGVISSTGGGSLTKTGTGTLTLTGSNTFITAANFNGGFIEAANLSNLGNAAALNFNGGGLRFDAPFDPSLNGRTITFQAGGAVLDTQTFNVTIANSIGNGGAGGLDKKGSGILELDGAVTYTGATTIDAGVLKIDNNLSTTLGAISGAGTLEVDGASTVLTATSINVGTLTLSPGAEIVIAALSGGPKQDLVITPVTAPNSVAPVPEPSVLTLLGMAALAMLFAAQRKRSKKSL